MFLELGVFLFPAKHICNEMCLQRIVSPADLSRIIMRGGVSSIRGWQMCLQRSVSLYAQLPTLYALLFTPYSLLPTPYSLCHYVCSPSANVSPVLRHSITPILCYLTMPLRSSQYRREATKTVAEQPKPHRVPSVHSQSGSISTKSV